MKINDLKPGDVLLFSATGWGILTPLVRLCVTWGHAAIYYTETKRGLPLIIESTGRGVTIGTLLRYSGQTIYIMRPVEELYGPLAAKAAERLADNPGSWYGYWDIPRFVIPKLILAKLGGFLPAKIKLCLGLLAYTYHRNSFYICSELVEQAYRNAGYPLFEEWTIPLPDDIADSPNLRAVGQFTIGKSERVKVHSYG